MGILINYKTVNTLDSPDKGSAINTIVSILSFVVHSISISHYEVYFRFSFKLGKHNLPVSGEFNTLELPV